MTPEELENFLAEYRKFCWAWYEIHPGSPPGLEEYCQLKFGLVQWQKMKREHAEVEMNNLKQKTWTPPAPAPVTVRDVYGMDDPKAPEGWEFTGEFRPVAAYEDYMHNGGGHLNGRFPQTEPRLLLRPTPPPPTLLSVYGTETPKVPAGWKGREFRSVKRGEFYLSAEDHRMDSTRASKDRIAPLSLCQYEARHCFNAEPRLILTPVTEEDVYTLNAHGPIPTGYKRIAFRVPNQGEFYLSPAWNVAVCNYANIPQNPRIILEKIPAPTKLSVYGTATPAIPKGWEEVGFRPGKRGDMVLGDITERAIECINDTDEPRIILRRLPDRVRATRVLEYEGTREWVAAQMSVRSWSNMDGGINNFREISRKIEPI